MKNLIELARKGDPDAIATLLTRFLPLAISLSVDWQGKSLNLRFTAAEGVDQIQISRLVQQKLQLWSLNPGIAIQLFGYRSDQPAPLWNQVLDGPATPVPAATAPEALEAEMQIADRFLICGLGSLGQYCALNLKRFALKAFEIHITAIDRVQPQEWEVHELPNLLDAPLVIGDCRDDQVLLQAGIATCRAVLLVTDNDSVNVESAIAARRLNPKVRLVVRSSRQNLNQLLRQQLGNFVAFEPTELPATAFALAGLGTGILGHFQIGDCQLQVVEQEVAARDLRFAGLPTALLHKKNYRLLSHHPTDGEATVLNASEHTFHQWQRDTVVQPGDRIAYIEVVGRTTERTPAGTLPRSQKPSSFQPWLQQRILAILRGNWRQKKTEFWQWLQAQRTRQATAIGLVVALCLWLLEVVLLKLNVTGMTWIRAVSNATILLLGGYGDLFGGLGSQESADRIPVWLNLISLGITIISFLFILSVFGLIADSLLTTRFDFLRRRLPIPKQDHVILIGFGRVGQRVAALLQAFRQPVVAITEQLDNTKLLTQVPLIVGDFTTELLRVNLATARSVMVLTEDQMLNLEVALFAKETARLANHQLDLVIRTYDQRFRDNLQQLLPDAKALTAYALSAEAFAGAAFGENILGLFRLNNRTILVTEYLLADEDTLVGKLLSEVAYGYGVVPIFHRKSSQAYINDNTIFFMPSEDIKLQSGDRLVVLASLNGLRRIEHDALLPRSRWRLTARKPLNSQSLLDASSILHRVSGYHLDAARAFMRHLPGSIELSLYDHQAHRLLQKLSPYVPVKLSPLQPPETVE